MQQNVILEKRLFDEMYRSAGRELAKKMFVVLESRENCVKWFYSPLIALGNKRPYDYCMAGKQSQINNLLDHIKYGIIS